MPSTGQPSLDLAVKPKTAPRGIARTLAAGRPLSAAQLEEAQALDPATAAWIAEQQAVIVGRRMEQGLPVETEAAGVADPEIREQWRADRRASVAQRVREFMMRQAEVGPVPMVMDHSRRAACALDLERFGYTYLAGRDLPLGETPRAASPILREYIRRLQTIMLAGGSLAVALPRGYAKTAWAVIAAIWGSLYGHADYIVLLAANDPKAKQLLSNVRHAIETSELLLQDFPAVCHPVRALEGNVQRCFSQAVDGRRTRIEWGVHWIVMPSVEDSPASGNIIAAYSIDSGFHGLVRHGRRPKVAILDDVQTEQTAKSPSATADLEHVVQVGVMGLGGHDRPISILMACTCIQEGDLSDRFLDTALHPEFAGIRMRVVLAWPERQDLWDHYAELWRDDQRNGHPHLPQAGAYYAANREAMDQGAELSDPDLYDHRILTDPPAAPIPYELSAIQHAWNERLRRGEDAYFSQIENAPRRARGSGYDLATATVAGRLNGLDRRALPPGARALACFVDVNEAAGLRWALVAIGRSMVGAVVDYGRFPARGRLCPPNLADLDAKRRVYDALAHLLRDIEALNLPIRCLGIDRGYMPDIIHLFARNARARFPILPCWGFGSTRYRPEGKHTVGQPGHYCHLSESPNGQFLAVQADYWREVVQRAFLAEPLAPGSLSLWGRGATAHMPFAENITAEVLADKAIGATGTFWKWHHRPGAENHWLDATVGCFAILAWFRFLDPVQGLASISTNAASLASRPRKYRETRKAKVSVE